jgi:uncharacterized membrane protein
MKYTTSVDINLPRHRVIELFDSAENMYKWQKGLQSFETFEGEPGQEGAKSKLHFKMGKREIEMVETITKRNLPDEFFGTYEAKGVWNGIENYFSEKDENTTEWKMECEFQFRGFMKFMAFLMPGAFKKQTLKNMMAFKEFAEAEK